MISSLRSLSRIGGIILGGILIIQGGGWLLERKSFAGSNTELIHEYRSELGKHFQSQIHLVQAIASELSLDNLTHQGLAGDEGALRLLFERCRISVDAHLSQNISITVYDTEHTAVAWAGRPSRLTTANFFQDEKIFLVGGAPGLTLVNLEPVFATSVNPDSPPKPVGTVATEWTLVPTGITRPVLSPDVYQLTERNIDVYLTTTEYIETSQEEFHSFPLTNSNNTVQLWAHISDAEIDRKRQEHRDNVRFATLGLLSLFFLLAALSFGSRFQSPRDVRGSAVSLGVVLVGIIFAAGLIWIGQHPDLNSWRVFSNEIYSSSSFPSVLRSPADLLLFAVCFVFVIGAICTFVELIRRQNSFTKSTLGRLGRVLVSISSGVFLTVIIAGLHLIVQDTIASSPVDFLHTSLTPWDSGRLSLLLSLSIIVIGAGSTAVYALVVTTRAVISMQRVNYFHLTLVTGWIIPILVYLALSDVSLGPHLPLPCGIIAAALLANQIISSYQSGSQTSRILIVFTAMVVPTLLFYPSLWAHSHDIKKEFVQTDFSEQASNYPTYLQNELSIALSDIDSLASGSPSSLAATERTESTVNSDRAFHLWRQTQLARVRLTSAIELYDSRGRLNSRFALNFPEYTDDTRDWIASSCDWEIFGEVVPFGSTERRTLHAERNLCRPGDPLAESLGSVVVHLALDYSALPFISRENPYNNLISVAPSASSNGLTGQDVELAIYGWGLRPVFTSGNNAWSLDDSLISQVRRSRDPFWAQLQKSGRTYELFITNNRSGIYLLGFPSFDIFDHLVRCAELVALIGAVFLLFLAASILFSPWLPISNRFGNILIREIRTSFYKRLFLAFVAATIIPLLALAISIRSYFTTQLREEVELEAARTAAIAKGVIEESVTFQQSPDGSPNEINDDLLVFLSQVLDQDVNIFAGAELLATSERDLFASGLLPTRTLAPVYVEVAINNNSNYVIENDFGGADYLIAATQINASGRDAILTVPLASRQEQIETQIADIDRRILLGLTFFILLGAASGFYMAERIADPLKRLTRATKRISKGNFSPADIGRTSDEFQRLVEDFNQMASDLKTQQGAMERTHRLEAWAEMARQVAHEIKNPLTPVQLSAEHLVRVNRDRGEPLSPELQNCVDSILSQVTILRQISSEFSNYASTPRVDIQSIDVSVLFEEVLSPYLIGLSGRINVTRTLDQALPRLLADRTLLSRALVNVIDNALHAMPEKGCLDLSAKSFDGHLKIVVQDTGVGIDENTLKKIFEPYFSTKVSGTGLGMAIAKRNTELSGGKIFLKSTLGKGTTVTFQLPCDL